MRSQSVLGITVPLYRKSLGKANLGSLFRHLFPTEIQMDRRFFQQEVISVGCPASGTGIIVFEMPKNGLPG
jgi:hypothetical protein